MLPKKGEKFDRVVQHFKGFLDPELLSKLSVLREAVLGEKRHELSNPAFPPFYVDLDPAFDPMS